MKRTALSWIVTLLCVGSFWVWGEKGWAFQRPSRERLPDLDVRQTTSPSSPASEIVPAAKLAAAERLRGNRPDLRVDFDAVSGSPKWVGSHSGFLTGPNGQGISAAARGNSLSIRTGQET